MSCSCSSTMDICVYAALSSQSIHYSTTTSCILYVHQLEDLKERITKEAFAFISLELLSFLMLITAKINILSIDQYRVPLPANEIWL